MKSLLNPTRPVRFNREFRQALGCALTNLWVIGLAGSQDFSIVWIELSYAFRFWPELLDVGGSFLSHTSDLGWSRLKVVHVYL